KHKEETPAEFLCKEAFFAFGEKHKEETPAEFLCKEAFFAFGEKHKEETPAEFLCKEAFFAFGEKHKEETPAEFLCKEAFFAFGEKHKEAFFAFGEKHKGKKKSTAANRFVPVILAAILFFVGSKNYFYALRGYRENSAAHLHNINAATYVRENHVLLREAGTAFFDLTVPLKNETYAHGGSLHSESWYVVYFMQYYDVYEKIDITDRTGLSVNRLLINGGQAFTPNAPVDYGGGVFIPLNDTVECLNRVGSNGYSVSWNERGRSVTVFKNGGLLFRVQFDADGGAYGFTGGINGGDKNNGSFETNNGNNEKNENGKTEPVTFMIMQGRVYMSADGVKIAFGLDYEVMAGNEYGGYDVCIKTE
ncbi:MAG: hypothetical protein FWE82_07215, partial [Defluviitaleaceae bacterium]|nr:hypothetical protein [Defluviitaleaceae bacterium]